MISIAKRNPRNGKQMMQMRGKEQECEKEIWKFRKKEWSAIKSNMEKL